MLQVWVAVMVTDTTAHLEDSIMVFSSRAGAERYIRETDTVDEDKLIIIGPEAKELPPVGTIYWLLLEEKVRE